MSCLQIKKGGCTCEDFATCKCIYVNQILNIYPIVDFRSDCCDGDGDSPSACASPGTITPTVAPLLGPFKTGATVYEITWAFLNDVVPPCCAPGSYVLSAASSQGPFNVSISQAGNDATLTVTAAVDILATVTQDVVLSSTHCNGDPQILTLPLNVIV